MKDRLHFCKIIFFLLCHKSLFRVTIPLLLFFFTGCLKYRIDTPDLPFKEESLNHPLYEMIPRHRCQLAWYDVGHWTTWMLFGNDDDGIFGEPALFHPKEPAHIGKAFVWQLRNPLHNFCFYVIGSAHRKNSEIDLIKYGENQFSTFHYRDVGCTNFPCETSCFYLALHGWKPFISLRLAYSSSIRSEFYLGWRERGNFGIKFLPLKLSKPTEIEASNSVENSLATAYLSLSEKID